MFTQSAPRNSGSLYPILATQYKNADAGMSTFTLVLQLSTEGLRTSSGLLAHCKSVLICNMMYDGRVLVIDNGSDTCKAGFAGDDVPSVTFSSMVSRRRFKPGVVVNWDDAEYIWKRVYNELNVFSQDHPVLLTGSCHSPQASREKVAEIMFETFRTPALYLANQSVLALYASGRLDGAVLYCGESVTEVVPVSEGGAVDLAITRFDVSGRDLTEYLNTLLTERIINFARNSNRDVVQNIKEQRCYVESNFDKKMRTRYCKKIYTLPDGQVITLEKEMFKCPESLFQPSLVCPNYMGIHEATHNSIMKCSDVDTDLRQYMFSNIVLAGGSTMFPGFADRLQKEITTLAPRSVKVKVISPESLNNDKSLGLYSVWVGGSVLGSISLFPKLCCSKQEYDESGPWIFSNK